MEPNMSFPAQIFPSVLIQKEQFYLYYTLKNYSLG